MTYEEVEALQISNIVANTSDLIELVKTSLGIIQTNTIKDTEISMLIGAGVADMIRQGIDVAHNMANELIQATIVMFVKSNFEYLDEATRKRALEMYRLNCTNLSLSQSYKSEEQ